MVDYYQILGLTPSCSVEDVKRAYRKLSLKYHPDKTPDKKHHALFIEISNAYETLGSPQSKAKYDKELAPKPKASTYSYTASTSSTYAYSSYFSNTSNTSSPSTGYHGFYQHVYGRRNEEQRKAEEERARFQAEQWKKEMLERARAEEKIRREQELRRHEQERQEQERNKENLNAKHNKKPVSPSTSPSSSSQNDGDTRGANSSDPIVLDDDEAVRVSDSDSFYSVQNDEPESPKVKREASKSENASKSTDQSRERYHFDDIDYTDQGVQSRVENLFNNSIPIRPRQESPFKRRSHSPKRTPMKPSATSSAGTGTSHDTPHSTKRHKPNAFSFDDLHKNLGVNIDNVDFNDMFDSLPNDASPPPSTPGKYNGHRKMSDTINSKSKRPKIYEYYDGTSKAETLHTPINKSYIKGHSIDAVKELEVDFKHEPPKVPTSELNPNISKLGWLEYVASIQEYQKDFSFYKKKVVEYQTERIRRDEVHSAKIEPGSTGFDTYQRCLEKDLYILQRYTEAHRIYNDTMNVYKQNCRWMSVSRN